MNKKSEKKYIIYVIIFVVFMISISFAISYAFVNVTSPNNFETEKIDSSVECLDITYSETGTLSLTEQYPVMDSVGESSNPVNVTITNTCTTGANINYTLVLTSLYKPTAGTNEDNYIADSKIKVQVKKGTNEVVSSKMLNSITSTITTGNIFNYLNNDFRTRNNVKDYTIRTHYIIATGSLVSSGNASDTYSVRLWIDYNEGGSNSSTQGLPFAAAISAVVA